MLFENNIKYRKGKINANRTRINYIYSDNDIKALSNENCRKMQKSLKVDLHFSRSGVY